MNQEQQLRTQVNRLLQTGNHSDRLQAHKLIKQIGELQKRSRK